MGHMGDGAVIPECVFVARVAGELGDDFVVIRRVVGIWFGTILF